MITLGLINIRSLSMKALFVNDMITDFAFADFLFEIVLDADKVLIVGDFNIHVDNEKYALESAFIDILNSIKVRLG